MISRVSAALEGFVGALRRMMQFSLNERVEWYDNMRSMTAAKIPVKEALIDIARTNRTLKRKVATVYERMSTTLRSGDGIAVAAAPFVPPTELMLLAAGERASSTEGFATAGIVARAVAKMRNALIAGLAYPIILFVAAYSMLLGLTETLLPVVERSVDLDSASGFVRGYAQMCHFVSDYQTYITGSLAIFVAVLLWSMPSWRSYGRSFADKYSPVHMLYRYYLSAIYILSLGTLVRAKLPTRDALMLLSRNAPVYLRDHITRTLITYRGGENEADAFNTGLLPVSTVVRISALSRSSSLQASLSQVGEDIVEYSVRSIARISGFLNVAAIILIAALVASSMAFVNEVGQAKSTTLNVSK